LSSIIALLYFLASVLTIIGAYFVLEDIININISNIRIIKIIIYLIAGIIFFIFSLQTIKRIYNVYKSDRGMPG
jgi:drug/metabolite transporter superfamily protein YnfA